MSPTDTQTLHRITQRMTAKDLTTIAPVLRSDPQHIDLHVMAGTSLPLHIKPAAQRTDPGKLIKLLAVTAILIVLGLSYCVMAFLPYLATP